MERALIFYNRKDYKIALNELLKQNVDKKKHPILSYYLGLCYVRLKKYDEALTYLEQTAESEENHEFSFRAKLLISYINIVNGDLTLAETELKKIVETGSANVAVYCALGHVLYKEKRYEEALYFLRKALEIDPRNCNALNSINYIKAETTNDKAVLNECLNTANKILKMDFKNACYLDSLGWIYHKLNMEERALEYLELALKASPKNKDIIDHIEKIKKNKMEKVDK